MQIIGLNGRMGSGKDTAISHIRHAARRLEVQRAAFADKLKISGMRSLGFDSSYSTADMVKLADEIKADGRIDVTWDAGTATRTAAVTGREFWQLYGTEAHRDVFGLDFWVDALLPTDPGELSERFPGTDVLAVTDVRFHNEAQRILDLGGTVWKIDADRRLGPLPGNAHISEHGLAGKYLTCTVPNNGTVEQFEVAVAATARWILGC